MPRCIRLPSRCLRPVLTVLLFGFSARGVLTASLLDFRVVMSDRAAGHAAEHGMVTGEMAHAGANRGAAEATGG
jgi:hypothetical protein